MSKLVDGFEMTTNKPVDKATVCQNLSEIKFPYEGLITYQKSDGEHYKYENGAFKLLVDTVGLYKQLNIYFMPYPSDIDSNTTALQKLLDKSLDGENIKIIFRSGTYELKMCYCYSNTEIELQNDTILDYANNTNNVSFFNFNPQTATDITEYNGHGNIYFHGGTIIHGHVMSMLHAHNMRFENITIKNNRADHAFEISGSRDVIIRNCKFLGMAAQSDDRNFVEFIQIENTTAVGNPYMDDGSKTYDNTPCDNITIENCYFDIGDEDGFKQIYGCIGAHGDSKDKPSTNIVIRNNESHNTLWSFASLRTYKNITIENNKVYNSQYGIYGTSILGQPCLGVDNCIIANNYFNNVEYGVFLYEYRVNETQGKEYFLGADLKILNNTFNVVTNTFAVYVVGFKNLTISNNTFSDLKSIAIQPNRCINTIISNNSISGITTRPFGIQNSNNTTLSNNVVKDITLDTSSLIYIQTSNIVTIDNNIFQNITHDTKYYIVKVTNLEDSYISAKDIYYGYNTIINSTSFDSFTYDNVTEPIKLRGFVKYNMLTDTPISNGTYTVDSDFTTINMLLVTNGAVSDGTYKTYVITSYGNYFTVGDTYTIICDRQYTLNTSGSAPTLVETVSKITITITDKQKITISSENLSYGVRRIDGMYAQRITS